MTTTYTIDASGRTVGRVASEAASIIMGKNRADFVRNSAPKVSVSIVNAGKAKIMARKMLEKEYIRHSGYPGGQKSTSLSKLIEKFGYPEVFRRAVYGMLPKNKMRNGMIKNLVVTD